MQLIDYMRTADRLRKKRATEPFTELHALLLQADCDTDISWIEYQDLRSYLGYAVGGYLAEVHEREQFCESR